MAIANSRRQGNTLPQLLPSTIATRVRRDSAATALDEKSFAQLLDESLGTDEHGVPNISGDIDTNQKLVNVVLQVGIEPIFIHSSEDPFFSLHASGRRAALVKQCLLVFHTVVSRSPRVLYETVESTAVSAAAAPLYTYLFTNLVPLFGWTDDADIQKSVASVISISINQSHPSRGVSEEVLVTFLLRCLTGIFNAVARIITSTDAAHGGLVEGDFASLPPMSIEACRELHLRMRFQNCRQIVVAGCELAVCLLQSQLSQPSLVLVKKHIARIQTFLDDVRVPSSLSELTKVIRVRIGILQSFSSEPADTFHVTLSDEWPDVDRAHKRPRLSSEAREVSFPGHVNRLCAVAQNITLTFAGKSTSEVDGISAVAGTRFKTLSESEQSAAISDLGLSACHIYRSSPTDDSICNICENGVAQLPDQAAEPTVEELMKVLMALKPLVQSKPKLRVLTLAALRRVVSHVTMPGSLMLKSSPAGDFVLQSLKASNRGVRIAAAATLQAFVRGYTHRVSDTVHENRIIALEALHALWKSEKSAIQETVIVALARMAEVVDDEELNLVLGRMIGYFAHSNAYLTSTVYSELQQLALNLQVSVQVLFRPFWRTIGVVIVSNFSKRPAVPQQVADLIGVQMEVLLHIMEEHVLPWLVLHRNQKLIERMGASSSSPMSPFEVCTKPANFVRILSYLLSQSFSDPEETIMNLLINVSGEFREQDLAGWVTHAPYQIFCELVLLIGDVGQGQASKIHRALQTFTHLLKRPSGQVPSTRRTNGAAAFIEANALAITTYLTKKINEAAVLEPNVEKRRCLTAVGELVSIGKSAVRVALPQICASLRAAMDDKQLANSAFKAWAVMMNSLEKEEAKDLVCQTFAVIVRTWNSLTLAVQADAYQLVGRILADEAALIGELSLKLPSLATIPSLIDHERVIQALKQKSDDRTQLAAFVDRVQDESESVVELALEELVSLLHTKAEFVQKSIIQEQPEPFIRDLTRNLLNACIKYNSNSRLLLLGGQCLGAIGCLDPNRIESLREKKTFILLSDFTKADETTAFLMFFMEHVLVREYVSSSNLREKGFLAWSLQNLLQFCDLPGDVASRGRTTGSNGREKYWFAVGETTRLVLTPFLSSKYQSIGKAQRVYLEHPYFKPGMTYRSWLTEITLDFLTRASGTNVDVIFDVCRRLVAYSQSTAISSFLLPYAALNLILSDEQPNTNALMLEIAHLLQQPMAGLGSVQQEDLRQCSQSIFDILDYLSVWLQEMRKQVAMAKVRAERGIQDLGAEKGARQIELVADILGAIPPAVITQRSIECKSFARALFHQEQFLASQQDPADADYKRLQDIYAQIDEPDGIEGISAQMKFPDVESEIMEHKKAGRWNAAQSWYEMQLIERPEDSEVHVNLMSCLKESGQYDILIHHFDGISREKTMLRSNLLPSAIEAAWMTTRWDKLTNYLADTPEGTFAVHVGDILETVAIGGQKQALTKIDELYKITARDMTANSTLSFHAAHDALFRTHVLEDLRIMLEATAETRGLALDSLKRRLGVLGSGVADKQYLLGVHRAMMQRKFDVFKEEDIASLWISSARLARKAQATNQAFNAVLRATTLGDTSAAIEQAKLMWIDDQHRKAIQMLEGAIDSGAFGALADRPVTETVPTRVSSDQRNDMTARAFVLLGKWLDQAGQTQSDTIIKTFRRSTQENKKNEKGWYNLGRHYNKILDSERQKPPGKENQHYLTGETAKLVIDNFLKSVASGNKYLFQTLPKILTLWLELAGGANPEHDPRRGNIQFHKHNMEQRKRVVEETNNTIRRYLEKLPAYTFYTVLPQLVARICHSDSKVYGLLEMMIVKPLRAFPQQALWTVYATVKSSSKERAIRGINLLRKAVDKSDKQLKVDLTSHKLAELRDLVSTGQKFTDELLRIADYEIRGTLPRISLARDMGFNHKIAPSRLVVPCESCLTPNIPTSNQINTGKGQVRPFSKDPVTITAFLDEAGVLGSLQKPRKLSLRGSDGNIYSVLAKPHDDLRKDQRLLEFDSMIDRFLKHDINASKRRLYIRTYAVVPLNEECGIIEWVGGLKTMREIVVELYKQRGIAINLNALRDQLNPICAHSENIPRDFVDKILSKFPPVLRQWFVEQFPEPSEWLNARLRYTRTSAVMSVVGHVLGLGDRHGENILFEQHNGGVLHVDFNCLFDKGLTFEKPEMVPFRLTHNMVNAMGSYGYDGPFRRSCEITLQLLRNNEDGLMTILETFLHDPTTDFATAGKKRRITTGIASEVPDTPERMLEGVKGKVRGMLVGESVPLSVGGYVDWLIKRATDHENLAKMYVGWCAFF